MLFICQQKEIAANLVKENGKTMADAEGDVLRGLRKYIVLDSYNDYYIARVLL